MEECCLGVEGCNGCGAMSLLPAGMKPAGSRPVLALKGGDDRSFRYRPRGEKRTPPQHAAGE